MLFADAENKVQYVRDKLARHNYCDVSTVCDDGRPWSVCVKMIINDDMSISWYSDTSTLHSHNIARDKRVSILVYSHSDEHGDFGFYADAKVTDVTNNSDKTVQRYTATLDAVWVSDDSHIKQSVDL